MPTAGRHDARELNGLPSFFRLPVVRVAGHSNMSTRMSRCGCRHLRFELLESDSEESENVWRKSQVLRRYLVLLVIPEKVAVCRKKVVSAEREDGAKPRQKGLTKPQWPRLGDKTTPKSVRQGIYRSTRIREARRVKGKVC